MKADEQWYHAVDERQVNVLEEVWVKSIVHN